MWLGGYWWLGVSAAAAAVLAAKGGKDKQRKTIKLSVRVLLFVPGTSLCRVSTIIFVDRSL